MNQKSLSYLPLDSIRTSPDNPNSHSQIKVRTLANNMRRFGLLNPISVVKDEDGYMLVAGEGRLLAYRELATQEPDSHRWSTIPAIVLEDSDEFMT